VKLRQLLPALFLAALSLSAGAAQYACPDLSAAKQVNACPTEEELKHTYTGFCSDNAKAYAKETDTCPRYEDYRAMKNTALWNRGWRFRRLRFLRSAAGQGQGPQGQRHEGGQAGFDHQAGVQLPERNQLHLSHQGCLQLEDDKACAAGAANCRATCD
jgi:hypothetical protein